MIRIPGYFVSEITNISPLNSGVMGASERL